MCVCVCVCVSPPPPHLDKQVDFGLGDGRHDATGLDSLARSQHRDGAALDERLDDVREGCEHLLLLVRQGADEDCVLRQNEMK